MPFNAICDPDWREILIGQAVKQVSERYEPHPLFNWAVALFSEEFRWMAQHGITTLKAYNEVERIGRAGARIDRKLRKVVFEIYTAYRDIREQWGKQYDWDDLATAVCVEFDTDDSPRRYRHVVIDEGQDFSPEMIRSLAKAIPPDGSLTFFGDVAQQIYGHRMSWRSAGLSITKVWESGTQKRRPRRPSHDLVSHPKTRRRSCPD